MEEEVAGKGRDWVQLHSSSLLHRCALPDPNGEGVSCNTLFFSSFYATCCLAACPTYRPSLLPTVSDSDSSQALLENQHNNSDCSALDLGFPSTSSAHQREEAQTNASMSIVGSIMVPVGMSRRRACIACAFRLAD